MTGVFIQHDDDRGNGKTLGLFNGTDNPITEDTIKKELPAEVSELPDFFAIGVRYYGTPSPICRTSGLVPLKTLTVVVDLINQCIGNQHHFGISLGAKYFLFSG